MKILVAKFVLEANANVPMMSDLENTALSFGEEALTHMQLGDVFRDEDIELIPVICADAGCSGVMKKKAFNYIEQSILDAIKENRNEIDAIYLHLHGASEIEDLEAGSGEHHLLKEVRKIVGPYMPIGISCDPHGNLCKEYVESANIIRSFREAPHTDIPETVQFVCRELVKLVRERRRITPVYRKLPLILGGEQTVSLDEPVKSINCFMDALEEDERILSASWHVGYIRHDTPVAGCGIVVIPCDDKYRDYANEKADELASFVFDRRHEFHYTGITKQPEEALNMALNFEGRPVVISDSGDNVTSGSMGVNTFILEQVISVEKLQKKVLFASIHDVNTYQQLMSYSIGSIVTIKVGMGIDELSKPVELKVTVKYKGRQEGTRMYGEDGDYGGLVRVSVVNKPIDIVICENNHSFVEIHQIEACGCSLDDYDILIVKQGYIHPELLEAGKLCIMSLTKGATLQDTSALDFKLIMRPMFPIDNI
ncbi:microcystin degradation protein MlrC [Breznakia sp. PF5-3]|uniref:M81 family metallopeptidase n=1 Tax=unclassified Breznakia TaxID=2623764 RepID=UPI00240768D6|nr:MULTISPECIES: M81 family metallopeptidase [unclassified Breznakia]MDF9824208.1 microcystin degradation protein MlrC [Breznakia sp. PM6-1]MDF9835006.1 microcystin degradation protein MlrC [Breznakia sp. PF5-3]MDF9837251.1 microcystin degradation protein MlrC [Breznakia sp. PFB2-8]MDF9859241.1 microcystin degradation protein MlrC [Breznakia sp. PH5-24]